MSTRSIEYMPLSVLLPAIRNPKEHNLPAIINAIQRYGWTAPVIRDERTGRLVAGHGRCLAVDRMKRDGDPVPFGVQETDAGEWLIPVLCGWQSRNDTEAEAYIIADNNLTISGGWDNRGLTAMLEDIVTTDAGLLDTLGWTSDDLDDLLRSVEFEDDPPESGNAPGEGGGSTGEPDSVTCPHCHLEFDL